jgi:hypothetical protein
MGSWMPWAALVAHFYPQALAVAVDTDGEVTAGLAGVAVHDGIRGQLTSYLPKYASPGAALHVRMTLTSGPPTSNGAA